MASSSLGHRWLSFVRKLNEDTQADRVEWEVNEDASHPDLLNSDYVKYGPVYTTEVNGGIVRIYRRKIKRFDEDADEEYWDDRAVLEVRPDRKGDFIRVPRTPGIDDLYDSIVYRASNVDNFLDRFLKSKS